MKSMTILVAGATGQQGGSVISQLLTTNHSIRGLTRNTRSDRARALVEKGVEVVSADLGHPGSFDTALEGADAAFLVTTPFESGVEGETAQGIAFAEAAARVGLPYLVFSSVSDADQNTGIPHFESKWKVEERIRTLELSHCVFAPVYFFDNLLAPFMIPELSRGVFSQALSPTTRLQGVSARNIGEFATLALQHPKRFSGRRINIAGDNLTGPEYAAAISLASGREITFASLPPDQLRPMGEDMVLMYTWFESTGYSADIAGLRSEFPEVEWESFKEWAARQDWSVIS